jgi:flavin reductase (DIM6/NTAB) family NADH-FMN oxidoreductase RutF
MISGFTKINPMDFSGNPIRKIGDEWMLITAGNSEKFNTMTASWGGLGYLWNKPVAFIFIRPQRFTYQFTEQNAFFTLSFFEEKFKGILDFCGSKSGRDVDKIVQTGLKVFYSSRNNIFFEQSYLQMECRKLYFGDIDPANFLDDKLLRNYPSNDFHRLYIGEIVECIEKSS